MAEGAGEIGRKMLKASKCFNISLQTQIPEHVGRFNAQKESQQNRQLECELTIDEIRFISAAVWYDSNMNMIEMIAGIKA